MLYWILYKNGHTEGANLFDITHTYHTQARITPTDIFFSSNLLKIFRANNVQGHFYQRANQRITLTYRITSKTLTFNLKIYEDLYNKKGVEGAYLY